MAPHQRITLQLVHDLVNCLSPKEAVALGLILNALTEAKRKHPDWPADRVYGAAIVAEEAGELMKATLDTHYHKADPWLAKTEAEHTAVTALRFIAEFNP